MAADDRSAVLLAVGGLLHREVAIDDLLDRLVELVCRRLRADRGTVYLVDAGRGELVSRASPGLELEEIRLAIGQGVAGHVAASGRLVNVPSTPGEERFFRGVDEATGYVTRSILAAPLFDPGQRVFGVLQVLNHEDGAFSAEDERTMVELAHQTAVALMATTLYGELSDPPLEDRSPVGLAARFNRIIGSSEPLREACRIVQKAASTEATVLLTGETGTGKELFARAIHVNSPRADGAFVKIDCAALPETLVENELFGHEAGAFTGATGAALGKVDGAAGGTLFLDEIGELPLTVQGKLLRLLQDREFLRVGGQKPVAADVRVVAATHRDLGAMVAGGRFRQDLYYRTRVVELRLPPLRDRGEADIARLAVHFAREAGRRHRRTVTGVSPEAIHRLCRHPWPGNVRELEHCLESAVVLMDGERVEASDLQLPGPAPTGSDDLRLETVERRHVLAVLERYGDNRSEAARALGIARNTLARKLAGYGLRSAGEREDQDDGERGSGEDEAAERPR